MPTDEQLDKIVHAVLARLEKRAGDARDDASTGSAGIGSGELAIADNVVSAATLADRLSGVQRLIVPARAVVTPSARDLLKEKNITLVRALKSAATSNPQLVLGVSGVKLDASGLARSLKQLGIELEQLPTSELGHLAKQLADRVSHGHKLAVLLTDNVAAALCVANRHRGVRAGSATNRGEVNELIGSLGVNFLIVDAVRRGSLELQRIVGAFAAGPARQCPADLKPYLD